MFNNFSISGISKLLRFGKRGPVIVKDSGVETRIKARNAANTNDINVSGADPVQAKDFVTLEYLTQNTQSAINTAYATNTDITTNLNTSTANFVTNVPLFGTTTTTDVNRIEFISSTEVEFKYTGKALVLVAIHITCSTQRSNLNIRLKLNDVVVGNVGATGYIRASNNHNESTLYIMTTIDVVPDDIVKVGCRREANAGAVYMHTIGSSTITILDI